MQTSIKSITNIADPGSPPRLKVTVEITFKDNLSVQAELRGEFTEDTLISILEMTPGQIAELINHEN